MAPISINGSGSITGISAGGLPDDSIIAADIAAGAVTPAKLSTGAPSWDSSGRLFLTGQPAFLAVLTTGSVSASTVGNGGVIPFDLAAYNRGNHYNTSTKRFTAPVAGAYLFTWHLRINSATTYVHHSLAVNGNNNIASGTSGQSITNSISTTFLTIQRTDIIPLSAGDYVDVRQGDNNFVSGGYQASQCVFSGFFLG